MWDLEDYGPETDIDVLKMEPSFHEGEAVAIFRTEDRMGGAIVRKGNVVEGSMRQNAWDDTWEESHEIRFGGELTPAICAVIMAAWNRHPSNKPESGFGRLRWSAGSSAVRVDTDKRVLITSHAVRLCD